MPQSNDLSRSVATLNQDSTLVVVIEMSQSSWLVAGFLGPVEIHAGDRIVVSIVSGTQECLINDEHNLYLLFGGKRIGKDHPTHACPGYKIARGVMLGILAGLLGSTRLRPTLSPMELEVRLR